MLQTLPAIEDALRTTVPLGLFLVATMWLVHRAEQTGLSERAARSLVRRSGGSAWRLYLLVCALTAALTATVSLDGAVVLMLPLVLTLTRGQPQLQRPLLLGTIVVANTFSLAVPQGNPTNLVVMARLGLSPAEFVAHLLVPSLVATAICIAAVALAERKTLRCAVGPVTVGHAATGGSLPIPWRVLAQIAAVVAAFDLFAGDLQPVHGASLAWVVLLALGAGVVACAVNNLPASALLAGLLGSAGPGAYAVMTGLSVGALATPHGSVATVIVRNGAPAPATSGHLPLLVPATLLATGAAATVLWLMG